ncbi:hypothetical protein [Streptomyces sp. NPDC054961]
MPSQVILREGAQLTVFNIAWGYDLGDAYAHVTSNMSPPVEGATVDFFSTNSVVAILDPASGALLLEVS